MKQPHDCLAVSPWRSDHPAGPKSNIAVGSAHEKPTTARHALPVADCALRMLALQRMLTANRRHKAAAHLNKPRSMATTGGKSPWPSGAAASPPTQPRMMRPDRECSPGTWKSLDDPEMHIHQPVVGTAACRAPLLPNFLFLPHHPPYPSQQRWCLPNESRHACSRCKCEQPHWPRKRDAVCSKSLLTERTGAPLPREGPQRVGALSRGNPPSKAALAARAPRDAAAQKPQKLPGLHGTQRLKSLKSCQGSTGRSGPGVGGAAPTPCSPWRPCLLGHGPARAGGTSARPRSRTCPAAASAAPAARPPPPALAAPRRAPPTAPRPARRKAMLR
jgi:hypothetical protein